MRLEGWKFKSVEPSGWALLVTRLGGVVCLLFGLGILRVLWVILTHQP